MERRTVVYGTILTLLLVALATVGVLILRKRTVLTNSSGITGAPVQKTFPTDTTPYESLKQEPAWKPGVPIPTKGFDPYPEAPKEPELP